MPASQGDKARRNDRIRQENAAKIAKIRSSRNARLVALLDEMEETMTAKLGAEGYEEFLGSAPLETLLRRSSATRGGHRGTPKAKAKAAAKAGDGAKRPGNDDADMAAAEGDDGEQDHDFRYSTDVEQGLLDERRGASAERRAEIDSELDAVHASRLRQQASDRVFDEFVAEDAVERHRQMRADQEPRRDGMASDPAIGAPRRPANPGDASAIHADDFSPSQMRALATGGPRQVPNPATGAPIEQATIGPEAIPMVVEETSLSAGPSGDSHVTHVDGRVATSGAPTSGAEAPSLQTPGARGAHAPSGGHSPESSEEPAEAFRGTLEEHDDVRGNLSDAAKLQDEANDAKDAISDAANDEAKRKADQRKRILLRVLLPVLMHLLPIFLVIMALLMLAQCVDQLNPFRGLGGNGASATGASAGTAAGTAASASGAVAQQGANGDLPRVFVDPALEDMFKLEDEEEDDGAVRDYPYVATFFGSDDDWTDTLYASDDCINFHAIGTVPNEMRDPCIMLRNGRYWVITCLNDEDGHVWLMVSSSKDLKTWVGPTKNGPFSLDRLPYNNGYGTSANYDVVAPEWFLDEDNSVHVIFSCGHWGACHGHNWDDWMEAYMLDVDKLELSGKENKLTAKGPAQWMSVNSNYDDRIDGTIDHVNGAYYLTIKRHGLNMELWKNTSCSPSGWVRLKDCFLYGYEAPCLFQGHDGVWRIFGDGCPDVRPFGTKMWTSDSIEGDWSSATIHFFRQDGSEVPLVRHGTVLPVEGATGKAGGGKQSDGTLNAKQKAVINACKSVPSPGAGLCALWVGDVYEAANVGVTFRGHAYDWFYECCKAGNTATDPNRSTLKPGMTIAVPSTGRGAGATYGHVGIYIGGGQVMHNIGYIDTCTVDEWIGTYGSVASVGWGYPAGMG